MKERKKLTSCEADDESNNRDDENGKHSVVEVRDGVEIKVSRSEAEMKWVNSKVCRGFTVLEL